MGKTTAVDQLNDTTAFPWFLNFSKNFSADYRKCKSNSWDYLISIHDFKNSDEYMSPIEQDPVYKRFYLIRKYNERLLFYSKDKTNPWIIDDRDDACVILHRKNYFEFENSLSIIIDKEIEKKVFNKTLLTKKEIQLERRRLSHLAKLALLKTYKDESLTESDIATLITNLDSQAVINQFQWLMNSEVNYGSIQNEIKKLKQQQEKIAKELSVYFLKETEVIKIYSITSIWEKINKFVIKNKPMQFFSLFWYGLSTHANLLSWISFLLLFFCLSLSNYPIIFIILGISLGSYLIFRLVYLVKKESVIFPKISTIEAEQILDRVKIEVFNEEKSKNEFKLIHQIVYDLFKKDINLNEFLNSLSNIQKNFDPIYRPSLNSLESKLYQYLTEVYPKTQFIASLTINLSSIVLYTYLLTWAMHSVLMILGAISFATIVASPLAVGVLILITASFFLISHLCEFRSREDLYHRTISNRISEKSEYSFRDKYGTQQIIRIEKWKKFEYLQDNINFLEIGFKTFFEKNKLDNLNNKFYYLFNSYVLKKNVYNSYEQDQVLGDGGSFFKSIKKFLNRFFAFSGGGFYGYNLTQQIVWKSNLGIHTLVKTLTLPILLIFVHLIIINGIANLITYHLHSRQRNRFEMAKNLDSRLEVLEQANKKLLYLASLLSLELKHSPNPVVDLSANLETASDLLLSNTNILSQKKTNHFCFFKGKHQEINPNKKNEISRSMLNI
ncbi:hypothetical protein [Rickettsiella endosymbiont of Aleochara curtula]|uniref:hypothetical protein n=1 Tax=Rickettsiella endosymbiont of Aleochara curtula TaxID=3077936 RepID=UPI00313B3878